jgi:RNA polymerase sigma factor (sigma-70 family)
MIAVRSIEHAADHDLWALVRSGNSEAFEELVKRYQSLVCAIAYSACGDLETSEDVGQETMWAAWHGRESLEKPERLRPWLCGIARNLARNARRRSARNSGDRTLDAMPEPASSGPGPDDQAASGEEAALVWEALGKLPEQFREPLILFYRENQSVAQVAYALDLSEDAAKQRLSRGRNLLRDQVALVVEGSLRRSRPGKMFTVAVMTGLAATTSAKAAAAAGPAVPGVMAAGTAAGLSAGAIGGFLGGLVGLAGSWFGTWAPAQMAPLASQRDLILRAGRRMLLVGLAALAVLAIMIFSLGGTHSYIIAFLAWMFGFQAYVLIESFRLARQINELQRNAGSGAVPNPSAVRARVDSISRRFRGRVFESRTHWLGLPVVHFNVSDPGVPTAEQSPTIPTRPRIARGWIAIGDDARGILLAIGGTARGGVAIGGRALGLISLGGVSIGLISIGGLALGILSLGGVGVGVVSIGGLAFGWQAAGGGAIAWDIACGGLAIARHAAVGGGAIARDLALGGGGSAAHFNDAAAKAVLLNHPLKLGMDWTLAHMPWFLAVVIAASIAPPLVSIPLFYRSRTPSPHQPPEQPPEA